MAEYVPPGPEIAEAVYLANRESADQYSRLEHARAEKLRRILTDLTESAAARANALLILKKRRDTKVNDLLPGLFEDKDLGHLAIRYCPASDPMVRKRLYALLDHPRDRVWSAAAGALVRAKDEAFRTRLLECFHGQDQRHRNAAIEGLIGLGGPEAVEVFRQSWLSGERGEEDRLTLAVALLRLGDSRGIPSLEAAARRAEGAWAVFAATSLLHHHDAALGYQLLHRILDHGDGAAKQSLVMHAWNMAQLPHAFTADGIHETRLWLEQQRQRHESPGQNRA